MTCICWLQLLVAPEVASMIQLMREETLSGVKAPFNHRENFRVSGASHREISVKIPFCVSKNLNKVVKTKRCK